MQVKLFDFGLCSFPNQKQDDKMCEDKCGTIPFAAPEIITQDEFDATKADIWSFGVTMYYIATRNIPFFGINNQNFKKKIANIQDYLNIDLDSPVGQIIKLALIPDPNKRPSAEELLKSPLFERAEKIRYQITPLIKTPKSHSTVLLPTRNPIITPSIISPFRKQTSEKSIRIFV